MLPSLISAPFSILTALLYDTNLTDVVRIFNESNVTTVGNFTFEPTTLLFINYPQSDGQQNASTDKSADFVSFVMTANNGSTTSGGQNTTASGGGNAGTSADCEGNPEGGADANSDSFMANLNSTTALQVSVNMTLNRSSITEAPIFALNGTYDASNSFFVSIFHFDNTSNGTAPCVHFLGGNFTAQSAYGGAISVLTNSTPALLEYSPPQNDSGSGDNEMLVYLLFQQNGDFNSSATLNSSFGQDQIINISDFINETGMGSPIGGSLIWLEPGNNDTDSAVPSGSSATDGPTDLNPPLSSDSGNEGGTVIAPMPTGSNEGGFSTSADSGTDSATSSTTSLPVDSSSVWSGAATGSDSLSFPSDSGSAGQSTDSPLSTGSGALSSSL